ncbi:MAG: 16S rRNA (cytidine(1402)-2'-O)-methyltransferase [Oscillospiraceae bacterium]|nr:16S rRNA (cytidine(1402)-2'-O)-methyltransferase [Oscillospiraceae bacterium]
MPGKLYVIGTPIGNLSDMTFRAVETLKEVDFIAAEDTRVTLKLLNHFGIKKPMLSYHEHSTKYVSETIIEKIKNGESCGVVTDAGMPCISDPGEDLVKACAESGIEVVVIPGPSAAISALAISGLSTSRFSFEGFLSVAKKQRREHLQSVKNDTRTLIFYEAPHKLLGTLSDMLEHFGDRRISICHELTKIHEEVLRMTISQAVEYYSQKVSIKGEFVLVIEGAKPEEKAEITIEDAAKQVMELVKSGMKLSDACKEIAKLTGFKKSELYSKGQE